jgi:hypothetical protein
VKQAADSLPLYDQLIEQLDGPLRLFNVVRNPAFPQQRFGFGADVQPAKLATPKNHYLYFLL